MAYKDSLKAKEQRKRYYEKNKNGILAKQRKYSREHKEQTLKYAKEYSKTHKKERSEYNKKKYSIPEFREQRIKYLKEYRERYKEELKEKRKIKYAKYRKEILDNRRRNYKFNKDKILEEQKTRRKIHPEIRAKDIIRSKKYYETHQDKIKKYRKNYYIVNLLSKQEIDNKYRNDRQKEIRKDILIYYGGSPPHCAFCKEERIEFLQIDHIDNDRSKHKKEHNSYHLYEWIKRNNYPPQFQVLCENCNWLKYLALKERGRSRNRVWQNKIRLEVLFHYGNSNPKCACCGQDQISLLTIDHMNNDGNIHRKKIGSFVYSWLKKNNYPKNFQILCRNCNHAKFLYGKCPHQKAEEAKSITEEKKPMRPFKKNRKRLLVNSPYQVQLNF